MKEAETRAIKKVETKAEAEALTASFAAASAPKAKKQQVKIQKDLVELMGILICPALSCSFLVGAPNNLHLSSKSHWCSEPSTMSRPLFKSTVDCEAASVLLFLFITLKEGEICHSARRDLHNIYKNDWCCRNHYD